MRLSPEERRRIYEEEKKRIEAEQEGDTSTTVVTTALKPNVAGLLCYLAGWITGIIFLVIEQENRFVRFHAMQSIVVFGSLTVACALLTWIPHVGGFFGTIIGILGFVLWIVLMIKAYQGELFKIPLAGDIAGSILPISEETAHTPTSGDVQVETTSEAPASPWVGSVPVSPEVNTIKRSMDRYFTDSKAVRLTASSFAIAWSIALLVFFSFFHSYVAYYNSVSIDGGTDWIRTPLLTDDYFTWLPILITTMVLSIMGHIILIVHDRYWLRLTTLIILNIMSIITIATLISIFPFDFDVIPSETWADMVPIILTIVLVCIAIGLGIGTIVMLIKFGINLVKEAVTQDKSIER